MRKRVLMIEEMTEVGRSMAECLLEEYDVTVKSPSHAGTPEYIRKGAYDSVLFVLRTPSDKVLGLMRQIAETGKARKMVVYAPQVTLENYKEQIQSAGATTLAMTRDRGLIPAELGR